MLKRLKHTGLRKRLYAFLRDRERERMLNSAMRFLSTSHVTGDYFEFGCYQGETFSLAHDAAQKHGLSKMRFYAFDSFQGLPEVPQEERDNSIFAKGMYACDEQQFRRNIKRRGVDMRKVTTIPGWYDKNLTKALKKKLKATEVAIAHIDCDLYESTVPVLEFLTDYLVDGALLIFDDWFCFRGHPHRGERRAFAEWRAKHKEFLVTEYLKFNDVGNSFIINKH